MNWHSVIPLVASALFALAAEASTLTPPVLPLIVRNPYLSTWLQNARDVPWSSWPIFWTGEEVGFAVLASVPSTRNVYPLLGRPQDSLDTSASATGYNVSYPVYEGAQYDASTTNLTYSIPVSGHNSSVHIQLSFLSPVTPSSTVRQSIPASYFNISVSGSVNVDIYVDVNGQWVSGDRGSNIVWSFANKEDGGEGALKTWSVKRESELVFAEYNDRAEWGTLHFSAPSDVRHESGTSALLRQRFSRTGTLQNENDRRFRNIMDEEPVFAFAKSFNLSVSSAQPRIVSDGVLFTIAHTQDSVVQFASARGLTYMRPLWDSYFSSAPELLSWHYLDFSKAAVLAHNYSAQLDIDAYRSGDRDYVDIVALSARQTLGATSFAGTPDNPILFLKEISSNGNSQTVDVIFPSFPFFLYSNPRWLAYLLEPLIEHMLSGQYPNKYSMHDLGTHFPNMTGHPDGRDEYMPVEECGDMLIMGLALANSLQYRSDEEAQSLWSTLGATHLNMHDKDSVFPLMATLSDGLLDDSFGGPSKGKEQAKKWLAKSYKLWKQWTSYLIESSLEPANQLSTDDFAGWLPLQTNLALKGIVGIKAMASLAELLDEKEDYNYYANISDVYIGKWQEYGISRDGSHAKLAYDWYGSWTTLYSLYADALLCFHPDPEKNSTTNVSTYNLAAADFEQQPLQGSYPLTDKNTTNFIPSRIYQLQSDWYAAVLQKYGLPLDSRHLYTKSDWEFEAAAVTSPGTRKAILKRVAKWLNETSADRPFTDLYNTEGDGGFPGPNFFARPVVGAHYAFLTLERACGGHAMDGLRGLHDNDRLKDEIDSEQDFSSAWNGFFDDAEHKKMNMPPPLEKERERQHWTVLSDAHEEIARVLPIEGEDDGKREQE